MTTEDDQRVSKLRRLVSEAGGPKAFARAHLRRDSDKQINESYVSQVLNGHRSFGEKAARNMETMAGLPDRYFEPEFLPVDVVVEKKKSDGSVDIPLLNVNGSMGPGCERPENEVVVDHLRVSHE